MKPPNLEICIEGYNIEQTDFYISSLIEKNSELKKLNEKNSEKLNKYAEDNEALRKEYLSFVKTVNENFMFRLPSIDKAINRIEARLTEIENSLGIAHFEPDFTQTTKEDFQNVSEAAEVETKKYENEIADLKKDLVELKGLFK